MSRAEFCLGFCLRLHTAVVFRTQSFNFIMFSITKVSAKMSQIRGYRIIEVSYMTSSTVYTDYLNNDSRAKYSQLEVEVSIDDFF